MRDWLWQHTHNGLLYLSPPWAGDGVTAAFSTRLGGISADPYTSLNLGLHVGDNPQHVSENRLRFLAAVSGSLQNCAAAEQIHKTAIVQVDGSHKGAGMLDLASAIPRCDALATQDDIGLIAFFADCVPLFFYDRTAHWIALAHAGWRGSVAGMARAMVDFLCDRGCQTSGIFAAIGPCVGSCCYEVDATTAQAFKETIPGFSHYAEKHPNGKYALDLQTVNRLELLRAGLEASHISSAELCTACHSHLFYSYRKNAQTGRMAGFIQFSPSPPGTFL